MREFRERSYLRKIFFSRVVFLLFVCATVLIGSSVFEAYKKSRVAVLKNEEVERDVEELIEKKEGLESNIKRLKAPAGIEAELREKFQVKKPGEEFVVIVEEKTPGLETQGGGEKEGFLEKTLNFIKNIF